MASTYGQIVYIKGHLGRIFVQVIWIVFVFYDKRVGNHDNLTSISYAIRSANTFTNVLS